MGKTNKVIASAHYKRDLEETTARIVKDRRYKVPRWAVLRALAFCALSLAALAVIAVRWHLGVSLHLLEGAVITQLLLLALAMAFHQVPTLKVRPPQ
jgi:hypothetical protein